MSPSGNNCSHIKYTILQLSNNVVDIKEGTNKFIMRGSNESYLVQCEDSDAMLWADNLKFALENFDEKLPSPRRFSMPVVSTYHTKTAVDTRK